MKLPIDHICQKCGVIRNAGREMDHGARPGVPAPNRCGNVYDVAGSMMAYICGGELVPLRHVNGAGGHGSAFGLKDGTPALVESLLAYAVISVPGLPYLTFKIEPHLLTPGFDEVPHKVWTGEPS